MVFDAWSFRHGRTILRLRVFGLSTALGGLGIFVAWAGRESFSLAYVLVLTVIAGVLAGHLKDNLPLIGRITRWPDLLQMDAHGFSCPSELWGEVFRDGFLQRVPWDAVLRARFILDGDVVSVTFRRPSGKEGAVLLRPGVPSPWDDWLVTPHLMALLEVLRARGVPVEGPAPPMPAFGTRP